MVITNNLDLPKAIVKAVDVEPHNKSDKELSATTLLKGVKEIILTRRHWEKLTDDAASRIWAIFGQAVHALLETEGENEFTECAIKAQLENDISITGRVDNYNMETGTIIDYKTASIWKVQFKDFEDWKKQGLVYAWLLQNNGFKVERCKFIAILKDHSKSKANYDSQYPQSPVYIYEFPVTVKDLDDISKFIQGKIDNYLKYLDVQDDSIPPCTNEERWATETTYAVMKTGNKKAIRVLKTRLEADNMTAEKGAGHYVEVRPGTSKKCAEYCICCDHCNFYNNFVKNQSGEQA